MGDCAINIDYQDTVDKATGEVKLSAADKLAEVVVETAKTAAVFGIDPKVAVLSFSTKGSGKGGTVALSHDATIKAQAMAPDMAFLPLWHRPSARAARWLARPTPSSSPASKLATSAIRSPSVWAAMPHTAPSCRA